MQWLNKLVNTETNEQYEIDILEEWMKNSI